METLLRHRGYVIISLVYLTLFGAYVLYERRPRPEPIEIIVPTAAPTPTPGPIQVHVAGDDDDPGVYVLAPNSRLFQAVEAAGGLTGDADAAQSG